MSLPNREVTAKRQSPKFTFTDQKVGDIVSGVFTPVLAKHSKSISLIDCISVGVDRMQRNFEPMRKQVEAWQKSELTDTTAKVAIYEAFVEGKLEAPKHLARMVHDLYSNRSMKNSGRGRSGVFRTHSPQPSRNWNPSLNSRPQPSWENSWKPVQGGTHSEFIENRHDSAGTTSTSVARHK